MGHRSRAFNGRDLREVLRHDRPRERGHSRFSNTEGQSRRDRGPRKLLSHIHHVGANRSDGQRSLAHVTQVGTLSNIERERHDVELILFGQPPDRHRRFKITGVGQYGNRPH